MASSTKSENSKSSYGKVVMSLENCILPPDKLNPTPSFLDGLDSESEMDLRILGCELIQTSGTLLRLPQIAMATAQVLFQRFYYARSFISQRIDFVVMACVVLASKLEEEPRRIEDVINVFHHVKQVRSGLIYQPLPLDENFFNRKNHVIKAERQLLKELGFCVHMKHPHKFILAYAQILELMDNQQLLQTAWNYANDGRRTDIYLRFQPETIACACIYLSARVLRIPLPTQPAWYLVFDASEDKIQDICHTILSLYTRKKPDYKKLVKMVEERRGHREEAKRKARALLSINKSQSVISSGVLPSGMLQPVVESKKEKLVENCGIMSQSIENNNRKRTYSGFSSISCTRTGSNLSSLETLPGGGSYKRHRHRSPSRNYKRSRRSESASPHTKKRYRKRNGSPSGSESPVKTCSSSGSVYGDSCRKRQRHRSSSRSNNTQSSGGISPFKRHSRSSSSDDQSSYHRRYERRSHKRRERTRSTSGSRRYEAQKSKHHSSSKEDVKSSRRSRKHSSRKDRYDDRGQHKLHSRRYNSRQKR